MTTAPAPVSPATDTSDLTHVACECTPDIALGGTDVSDVPWNDEREETTCVVCRDLEDQPCAQCGQ
ncbi:hypothetical protein ACF06P_35660 [Streptomyces sp. NPDC015684]|uniref:hypothetical protein n=1 Tax=Streptomyces sp. NPDC015684 TaxID=3364963 RepID=UPI0036FFBD2A